MRTYVYYKVAEQCSLLILDIYSCLILSFTNHADSCCIFSSWNSSQDWVRFEVFKVVTIKVTDISINDRGGTFLWIISIYCIYWNIRPPSFTVLSFQGNTCIEHVDPFGTRIEFVDLRSSGGNILIKKLAFALEPRQLCISKQYLSAEGCTKMCCN